MATRHLYLLAYDISDGRMRRRVRQMLLSYAVGGQKSLFECWLTQTELRELCAALPRYLHPDDKLHIFRLTTFPPRLFGTAKCLAFDPFLMV